MFSYLLGMVICFHLSMYFFISNKCKYLDGIFIYAPRTSDFVISNWHTSPEKKPNMMSAYHGLGENAYAGITGNLLIFR